MITIRNPEEVFHISGKAGHGRFSGQWSFSFSTYVDPAHERFGSLKAFNDDTLSPGAAWPLHLDRDTETVTYCAEGEFRHFDNKGRDGILKKGWVQHASVGSGMWNAEINNLQEQPLRFVEMRFAPRRKGARPRYEQKPVQKRQRTNKMLPLVSNEHLGALKINADAEIFSSFLQKGKELRHKPGKARGVFIYVLEGGPVKVNGVRIPERGCAEAHDERAALEITAERDAELILVDVRL